MHILLRFGPLCVAAALAACSIDAATFGPPVLPAPVCGDGDLLPTEGCDDGNLDDGDGCDSNCTATKCGNGVKTSAEVCDDGNATDGDGCDSNCTMTGCGNGIPTDREACDDGNAVDGDGCDSNCTASGCGNGVADPTEGCDDGNSTCGSCSASCQVAGNRAAAGLIHVVAPNLLEDETFTVQDDPDRPAVTFQFRRSGTTTDPSYILINIAAATSGNDVAPLTRDAINAVGDALWITATSAGTNVSLVHEVATGRGNIPITDTVDSGSFSVEGMAGGQGVDCAPGQACRSDADCVSSSCQANVCQ